MLLHAQAIQKDNLGLSGLSITQCLVTVEPDCALLKALFLVFLVPACPDWNLPRQSVGEVCLVPVLWAPPRWHHQFTFPDN